MMKKVFEKALYSVLLALLAATPALGQIAVDLGDVEDTTHLKKEYPAIKVSGGLGFVALKIIKSTAAPKFNASDSSYLNGMWMQSYSGRFGLNVYLNPKLKIDIGVSGGIYHGLQTTSAGYHNSTKARSMSRGLSATGSYAVGDPDRSLMDVKVGYFAYNYQHDIKNLGGFLFRSGTYPGIIYSGGSGAGFFGVGIHSGYIPQVRQDVIMAVESRSLTFAYVAGWDVGGKGILDIGAGGVFNHMANLIPDDPIESDKAVAFKEPITLDPENGVTAPRDTIRYTWRGAKLAARFCFDPKPMFGSRLASIFGDEDLELYGEGAILGLKDYPLQWSDNPDAPVVGYDDITERMPVLLGFNVPAFKALDYIAVEVEYYGSPYRNVTWGDPFPLPSVGDRGTSDDWKWSVQTARTFLERVSVSLRVASDHLHTVDEDGAWVPDERLRRTDEWYVQVGLGFGF